MQDQPDQAVLRKNGYSAASGAESDMPGLAALLDPTLSPLFEPPQPGVLDPTWSTYLPFLAWLLVNAGPSSLVTLGARTAPVYSACCDTVARFAIPTQCCAVVEPEPEGGPRFPADLLQRHATRHAGFSRIVVSPAISDPSRFAPSSIDLLITEAGGIEQSRWTGWLSKLSPRAVLVMHGGCATDPDTAHHGLRLACPTLTLHGGGGLLVAAVGPSIPPGLRWLFQRCADPDQASRLGARLGARLAALGERWRLERLLHDARDADAHRQAADHAALSQLRDTLRSLSVAHDRLRDELAASKADRFRLQRHADSMSSRLQDAEHRHREERAGTERLFLDRAEALSAGFGRRIEALGADFDRNAALAATDRAAERSAALAALAEADLTTHALRAALAKAQAETLRLRDSTSWRVTGPLRTLRALLRGEMPPSPPLLPPEWRPASLHLPETPAAAPTPLPHQANLPPSGADPFGADPASRPSAPPLPIASEPEPSLPIAPDPVALGPGGWRPIRRVLFVAGEPGTPGAAYRTARNAAACRAAGVQADCVDIAGVDPHNLAAADLVVLWRAGYSAHVQTMLGLAAQARTRVVFDIDDLIVQPALAVAEIIDGIRTTFVTEAESRAYFQSMQRTMLNCDLCTTTTRELAAAMGQQHSMVRVLPNSFDDAVERASRRAVRLRGEQAADGLVRLGYAGGTRTHQKDFATIVASLVSVLSQRAQVRLVLFRDGRSGEGLVLLDEFPALLPFADRIEWRDLVPLTELPTELARFDVSLCPLEAGNPFCDAKSELKYFESALAGVCVVATPTGPFRRAVQHGVTGFLPDDAQNWTDTLLRLVDDPALRRRMARAANIDVLWRFGPRRQAELWTLLLRELDGGADGARAAELSLRRGDYPPAGLPDIPDGVLLFSHDALGEALVTVGMTSFNYERHLSEALDSVASQTLEHLDLVVVDDGSTDGSVPLLLDWAERNRTRFNRLRILRTETNAGLGGARNLVFAEAETPWVMVLDSDNHLAPAACDTLLAAVQADAMAAFAYPRIRQFGGADLVTGADDFQPTRLAAGNYIDAMALVAKWAWAAAGGYYVRRDAMGWEDFSLWCRLVELGLHGVPVAEELAFYRVHARSMVNAITEQSDNKRAMVSFVEARHPWLRLRMRAARKRLERPAAH